MLVSRFVSYLSVLQFQYPKLRVRPIEESRALSWIMGLGWDMAAITIFNTIWMKRELIGTDEGYDVLRHEAQHVKDQAVWSWWFFITYFLILPVGVTLRALWEWRAYKENLKVEYELTGTISAETQLWVVDQFCGRPYGWMFPFRGLMTLIVARECAHIQGVSCSGASSSVS